MLFISFEGLDCSGKTTIIKLLEKKLLENNYNILTTREPGGSLICESIRKVILDKKNIKMDSWTEALLYIASRKQHLSEIILPALKNNYIVLCDRFIDSTIAYQGWGRNLSIDKLNLIQDAVIEGYKPNLTLFFDISFETMKKRMSTRNDRELNRLDLEDESFFKKVHQGYLELNKKFSNRIKLVNANQNIEKVFEDSYKEIEELVKNFHVENNNE